MESNQIQGKQRFWEDKTALLLLVLTVLWMALIFWFSAQPGEESSQMSGFVKQLVNRILNGLFRGNVPHALSDGLLLSEHLIRKYGHLTEYLVLGVLTLSTAKRISRSKSFLKALVVCALYASSDEFHQIFVSGRGPLVTDVLIDTAGSFAGISLAVLAAYLRKKRGGLKKA